MESRYVFASCMKTEVSPEKLNYLISQEELHGFFVIDAAIIKLGAAAVTEEIPVCIGKEE